MIVAGLLYLGLAGLLWALCRAASGAPSGAAGRGSEPSCPSGHQCDLTVLGQDGLTVGSDVPYWDQVSCPICAGHDLDDCLFCRGSRVVLVYELNDARP
jgi:hypothetical protein